MSGSTPLAGSSKFHGIKEFYNFIRQFDNTPSAHSISILYLYPHRRDCRNSKKCTKQNIRASGDGNECGFFR